MSDHALQTCDRPREKLDRLGPSALGDHELLAVVLGHGSKGASAMALASQLLGASGVRGLTRRRVAELRTVRGLGGAQAARVLAAIELGRRTLMHEHALQPRITVPRELAVLLMPQHGSHPVERAGAAMFDVRLRLQHVLVLSSGSAVSCSLDPREVFRAALAAGASAVATFHNHPSGDPTPSVDDRQLTHRLRAVGRIVGIRLIDHLILADTRYFSFFEHGELPPPGARRSERRVTSY